MKVYELNRNELTTIYQKGTEEVRKVLDSRFGDKEFKTDVRDRIKTYEDAERELGLTPESMLPIKYGIFSGPLEGLRKMMIIAAALNEGWVPDFSNSNQYKYYPWFGYKAGFGFSHSACVGSHSITLLGSRLCFKSKDLAEYAGKQFQDIYNEFLN